MRSDLHLRCRRHHLAGRDRQWECEPERAAAPDRAVGTDFSTHRLDDPFRDREPEPGAAEAPRDRTVCLAELPEEPGACLLRDADARVDDREPHPDRVAWHLRPGDLHAHGASVRELDGVADEVQQHLPQPPGVAPERPRHVGRERRRERKVLLARAGREKRRDAPDHGAQVEVGFLQLELAGFHLREVEDVVQDGEQRLARVSDDFHLAALGRVERRVEQQMNHAEHAVHGGADLVAHDRQEVRLGARGRIGARPLCAQPCRHVVEGLDHAAHLVVALDRDRSGELAGEHPLGDVVERVNRTRDGEVEAGPQVEDGEDGRSHDQKEHRPPAGEPLHAGGEEPVQGLGGGGDLGEDRVERARRGRERLAWVDGHQAGLGRHPQPVRQGCHRPDGTARRLESGGELQRERRAPIEGDPMAALDGTQVLLGKTQETQHGGPPLRARRLAAARHGRHADVTQVLGEGGQPRHHGIHQVVRVEIGIEDQVRGVADLPDQGSGLADEWRRGRVRRAERLCESPLERGPPPGRAEPHAEPRVDGGDVASGRLRRGASLIEEGRGSRQSDPPLVLLESQEEPGERHDVLDASAFLVGEREPDVDIRQPQVHHEPKRDREHERDEGELARVAEPIHEAYGRGQHPAHEPDHRRLAPPRTTPLLCRPSSGHARSRDQASG
jgi:hypothetical protein